MLLLLLSLLLLFIIIIIIIIMNKVLFIILKKLLLLLLSSSHHYYYWALTFPHRQCFHFYSENAQTYRKAVNKIFLKGRSLWLKISTNHELQTID